MKEWTLLCSGYSGEGEDMLLTRLTEEGDLLRTGGDRHGKNPSFCCSADKLVYAVSELPDGAAVDSYERGKGEIRHLGRIELPGRRGLCHLAAIGGVLYGSCYESGHFFALDLELTRVLWEYLPEGTPRAHWAQEMDGVLYLADLGNDRVYRFSLENGLPERRSPSGFPRAAGRASLFHSETVPLRWFVNWTECFAFSTVTVPAWLNCVPAGGRETMRRAGHAGSAA